MERWSAGESGGSVEHVGWTLEGAGRDWSPTAVGGGFQESRRSRAEGISTAEATNATSGWRGQHWHA